MASILGSLNKARKIWRRDRIFGTALALAYARLQLGYSFYHKFARTTEFRALGQTFHAFTPEGFFALFDEIYITQPYAFACDRPDPVIIDCGSNIGISVLFFKKLFPHAQVTCFEPDPSSFALLQKNLAANLYSDVQAHAIALSDRVGEITFYNDPGTAGNLCMSTDPARMNKHAITVPTAKLSDYIAGPVDYLKIDVEGAEDAVMQDLVHSGKLRHVQKLFMEYHHHIHAAQDKLAGMLQILETHGFGYTLGTARLAPPAAHEFQDILIYAYRK